MDVYTIFLIFYGCFLLVLSIITFFLYAKDKKMAQNGGGPVRIKEKTLLGMAAWGGALGAELARRICHHKTDKGYFSLTIYFSLLCEIALIVALIIIKVKLA